MEIVESSRKRLFIGLIAATSLAVTTVLALLWIVPTIGLDTIHPWASAVWGGVVALAIVLVGWASLGLALSVAAGRTLPLTKRLRGVTIKLFLPLMIILARLFGISKERVRNSFIKVNNELVLGEGKHYKPHEILLLLPHCLQSSTCGVRLTYDIFNCKRCGLCPVAGLLALTEAYGVHMAIATGGTIARRIVVQKRPRLILAVACERDLASGIQDTYPLPVFGVLNERPKGPCLDTVVPLERLEQALRHFLQAERKPVVILPRLTPTMDLPE
ncbi:hypothetical protein NNJEOMEG_03212 [Fundidesulfovibrio magnetotacticus]|uniref:DUF116 domain-containing protein n=1 Tax=Fundidesulfovibrio magnetotacticus TaxID=2730080 RepID=A0A6V8LWT2_9BACT|nr:DUF116 domain-containing protein [Fundidesulfovibrio magnetotacticus]GFK95350.1 hypothetical protein NNJEOMEG_03212 [Fundidesulfovibrio magnetotacticus]